MRGLDPDASRRWLVRMIATGEDPRFIARRLGAHASEDVGMADLSVPPVCVAAAQAVQLIGMPEARIHLVHTTVAIAAAPRSNSVIAGINDARADVKGGCTGEVPLHLLDTHYPGVKELGHGEGYLYPHAYEHGVLAQEHIPKGGPCPASPTN